jgi:hypothetical protein
MIFILSNHKTIHFLKFISIKIQKENKKKNIEKVDAWTEKDEAKSLAYQKESLARVTFFLSFFFVKYKMTCHSTFIFKK